MMLDFIGYVLGLGIQRSILLSYGDKCLKCLSYKLFVSFLKGFCQIQKPSKTFKKAFFCSQSAPTKSAGTEPIPTILTYLPKVDESCLNRVKCGLSAGGFSALFRHVVNKCHKKPGKYVRGMFGGEGVL
jgi:hypothetical protein